MIIDKFVQSAGVGRTGTYIACDMLLRLIHQDKTKLNVFKTVLRLREQRTNMVQTQVKYLYHRINIYNKYNILIDDCLVKHYYFTRKYTNNYYIKVLSSLSTNTYTIAFF